VLDSFCRRSGQNGYQASNAERWLWGLRALS
jgi:hypothetical protein